MKRLLAVLSMFATAASMQAVSVNFNFAGYAGDGVGTNTRTFNSSPAGLSVDVTGWAFNGASFVQGSVGQYAGGLGIRNSSNDNSHTIDNSGWVDYMLFHFTQSIDINSVTFGYVEGDSDFKYWIGNTGDLATLASSGGVSVLGGSSAPETFNINPMSTPGTWIAIAAEPSLRDRDDYFKISAMNVSTVPDSSSTVLLLGIALVTVGAGRRRLTT